MDPITLATEADITAGARAVVTAAATEAGRIADEIIGTGPLPGTPDWEAEQSTDLPARRSVAWHLLSLRVQLAAGLDGIETIVVLRVQGTTWATIGTAVGMSRQSAHERWGARSAAILDPVGDGLPKVVPNDSPA
ncbi:MULTISPECIES: hypothetical protein [unclassified Rhodococcus (in: high G+C Gram-positive bacteria)]|uniref:hypothetical protein n=1 Tax=unclassified Rhodococcus (in: high G+C Gram-positive bacteria) TaxID=192944 RepID=UPI000B9B6C53|nr:MULTISPECIES: hypothetical protein [unclassified Rhodococcus (in: high G+C Gram-positive bacteria)]OZE24561.1 hypothetical protein CH256_19710 [Rhodococcus sp. 05-2254-6]OZE42175.1 hypothetical protein CH259_01990 [Rhodococcus sp. 05-2254-4]OZE49895.1 hypothetical protein CH261_05330 [Rhodococcus sp. 05-2254-3]OZE50533.1 hypothetical protein CH283_12635 [Rhodococcus sp. 05-2254-2]